MTNQALATAEPTTLAPAPMLHNEWAMIKEQAEIMSRTNVVPKQYRDKPDDIIAAGLYGRELGFGIATSLNLIDVIDGNPEINAEGKMALIRSRGHSVTGGVDNEKAWMRGRRADTGDEMEIVFTWAEAEQITFASWEGPKNNRQKVMRKLVEKDNWKNFPQDMMWARCASRLGRRLFGDVLQGFSYDREEIQAHILDEPDEPEVMNQAPPIQLVRSAPKFDDEAPESAPKPEIIDVEPAQDTPTQAASEDKPPAQASSDAMASPAQHKYIEKLLGEKARYESGDRDGRHEKVGDILRRPIDSLNELTKADASKVIDYLNEL